MPEELDDREENEYGNEQEYDNGRKRSPDYAKRQMERAEQRGNIVFTEEQKEQILEYAAMTGDDYHIRKIVRDWQTLSVPRMKRRWMEILGDAREEIDGFPDRSVGMAELKGYAIPQMICFLFVRRWRWSFIVSGKGVLPAVRWFPWGLCQQRDDTGT